MWGRSRETPFVNSSCLELPFANAQNDLKLGVMRARIDAAVPQSLGITVFRKDSTAMPDAAWTFEN